MEKTGKLEPDDGREPSPFAAEPQEPAAFQGCSRPVLIGCGASLLVGALLFMLLIVKARDLFEWAFDQNAQQILEMLPADVSQEEEERLRRALAGASRAVTEGRIDARGLQDLLDALSLATDKGKEMTREDVLEATRALERVAGRGAADDDSALGGAVSGVSPQRGPPRLAVA